MHWSQSATTTTSATSYYSYSYYCYCYDAIIYSSSPPYNYERCCGTASTSSSQPCRNSNTSTKPTSSRFPSLTIVCHKAVDPSVVTEPPVTLTSEMIAVHADAARPFTRPRDVVRTFHYLDGSRQRELLLMSDIASSQTKRAVVNVRYSLFPDCSNSWNHISSFIKTSSTLNIFKKRYMTFFEMSCHPTYLIHHSKGVKHLIRLRVGLSHLRAHKYYHNFRDTVNPLY